MICHHRRQFRNRYVVFEMLKLWRMCVCEWMRCVRGEWMYDAWYMNALQWQQCFSIYRHRHSVCRRRQLNVVRAITRIVSIISLISTHAQISNRSHYLCLHFFFSTSNFVVCVTYHVSCTNLCNGKCVLCKKQIFCFQLKLSFLEKFHF